MYLAPASIAGQGGACYKNTQCPSAGAGPSQGIASCILSVSTHFPALAHCPRTWLIKDIQCRPIIFDFEGHKSRLTNKMKTAKYNFMCDSDWTRTDPDGLGWSHQNSSGSVQGNVCVFLFSTKLLHRFIA